MAYAQQHDTSVAVVNAPRVVDALTEHLEFIGYRSTVKDDGWTYCMHAHRPNFFVKSFPIGVRLVASFSLGTLDKAGTENWLTYLNRCNCSAMLVRLALVHDRGEWEVRATALLPATYDRPHTGALLDLWHGETDVFDDAPPAGTSAGSITH